MIDLKTLEIELHQARLARIDAQAAGCEVEELIWQVAAFRAGQAAPGVHDRLRRRGRASRPAH